MKPLVSICIPNYNYERFIGETIESVLKQTYNNYEVIICDNCSTDRSLEIINSYSDSRIKVYRNSENINLYENINKAISYSCGELIAILHSDDLYAPDFLEKIVQAYTHNPEQRVFVTGVYNYHDETKLALPHHPFKTGGIKPKLEVLIRLQQKNNIGNGVNVILHQECIAKAGMYSSNFRYASDYDL